MPKKHLNKLREIQQGKIPLDEENLEQVQQELEQFINQAKPKSNPPEHWKKGEKEQQK